MSRTATSSVGSSSWPIAQGIEVHRNTVTGSSTADVIMLLVDARKSVVERADSIWLSPPCCRCRTSSWW